MSQTLVLAMLKELGGKATTQELREFARIYYQDMSLAKTITHPLRGLKKWQTVDFEAKTKTWTVKDGIR